DRVTSSTDARSQTTTSSYDLVGRLTRRSVPSDADDDFTYDGSNGIGQLSHSARGAVAHDVAYDALGRPTTTSVTVGGTTYPTSLAYDAQSRLQTRTTPTVPGLGRLRVRNFYNDAGRLNQIMLGRVAATCTIDAQCQSGESCRSELGNVCGRTVWQLDT